MSETKTPALPEPPGVASVGEQYDVGVPITSSPP